MYHFTEWRDDGTDQTIEDLLRRQVREGPGAAAAARSQRFAVWVMFVRPWSQLSRVLPHP
jgi:hypothetical protein